ncbi:MAG: septum formation initiator family protein [Opitutales bacterium]
METRDEQPQGSWEAGTRTAQPWGHQLGFVAALVVFIVTSVVCWGELQKGQREVAFQREREAALSLEIRALQARIERQRAFAERLETDDALAERVLRDRLGYVREGDTVFRFPQQ